MFISGWLLLVVPEFLRIYFIMPFPGSQQSNTISIAYFLNNYIFLFRIAGVLLMAFSMIRFFQGWRLMPKIASGLFAFIALMLFLFIRNVMSADKMFIQPRHKILAGPESNTVALDHLVIGVTINGKASCYPIQIIGYHHQVQDTVGGTPVLVTYCTVCRTGRVYSPYIDGQYQHFRLVGMDHFNAMLEDEATKSWWRQENGEAIAGPLKGKFLDELPSKQTTLLSWIIAHPDTRIMQADADFYEDYEVLAGYDEGTIGGNLEGTDKSSWQRKSWVVGIKAGHSSRAYDWNDLKKHSPINDTIDHIPILLHLEDDSMTFHAWNRMVNNEILEFIWNDNIHALTDINTLSVWNNMGECVIGKLTGQKLIAVPAYQEFWHSWKEFHPESTKYAQ
jgi:hypothetical protein